VIAGIANQHLPVRGILSRVRPSLTTRSSRPLACLLTSPFTIYKVLIITPMAALPRHYLPLQSEHRRVVHDSDTVLAGASYYASTRSLSPEHYQELIDRGWRRSGSLLYLPDASRSCCVHYTIR